MDNPYAPPANPPASTSRVALYSPGHIAWAAFLGAPIAGCVLVALNYRRFGNSAAANFALIAGLIGTLIIMAIAFFVPDNFPNFVVPAAYTFGMYASAKTLQGREFEHRLANGDIKGSAWVATGIGLLFMVVLTLVLFAIIMVMPEEWLGESL